MIDFLEKNTLPSTKKRAGFSRIYPSYFTGIASALSEDAVYTSSRIAIKNNNVAVTTGKVFYRDAC